MPAANGVLHATSNGLKYDTHYDTIIVGGGAAGIGAAIGAKQARPESRVLVIESEACLGGAATHRGVLSYCGIYSVEEHPRRAVGGIWTELYERLVREGAANPKPDIIGAHVQNIEPEGLKRVLDELLAAYDIEVLLHCMVVGGERDGNVVKAIEVQERRGRRKIFGKAFVDCSGDGDLAFHVGASTRYGNHGHVNLGSLSTRFGGLQRATPSSQMWKEAIIAAKAVDPTLKKIIPKNMGILIRMPGSGDIATYMASAAYDARESASISAAERQGRIQAKVYLDILRKLPGHEGMYLVSTGPNFGTRESRHINSKYQLKKQDLVQSRNFDDTVVVGAWYMEYHDQSREDWGINFEAPPNGTFNIPLRCLQSIDIENLFCAGRCADGDKAASSAIRVMGTALATGQAAGTAASLQAWYGQPPDPSEVQKVLLDNGAFLDRDNLPNANAGTSAAGMNPSQGQFLNGH